MIQCLAMCMSVAETAQKACVNERTVYRRLKDPTFTAAIAKVRKESFRVATEELTGITRNAVRRLQELLTEDRATPSCQLSAARTVLELALKFRAPVDVEARLDALEASLSRLMAALEAGRVMVDPSRALSSLV